MALRGEMGPGSAEVRAGKGEWNPGVRERRFRVWKWQFRLRGRAGGIPGAKIAFPDGTGGTPAAGGEREMKPGRMEAAPGKAGWELGPAK